MLSKSKKLSLLANVTVAANRQFRGFSVETLSSHNQKMGPVVDDY